MKRVFLIFILCLFLVACKPIIEDKGTMTGSSAVTQANVSKLNHTLSGVRYCEFNNKSITGRVYYSLCYNETNVQPRNQTTCTYNITITNETLNITLNQNISENYTLRLNFTPALRVTPHSKVYQETATAYLCGGTNWSVTYPCSNIYDTDWNTFGMTTTDADLNVWLDINYTKKDNSTILSQWQIKDGAGIRTVTIPSDCWALNPLQFRVNSSTIVLVRLTSWYCYNGSNWNLLTNASLYPYEEAMWWDVINISNPSTNYSTINFTTTIKQTFENLTTTTTCANVYLDLYNSKERWYVNTTTKNKTWVIPFNAINLTFT